MTEMTEKPEKGANPNDAFSDFDDDIALPPPEAVEATSVDENVASDGGEDKVKRDPTVMILRFRDRDNGSPNIMVLFNNGGADKNGNPIFGAHGREYEGKQYPGYVAFMSPKTGMLNIFETGQDGKLQGEDPKPVISLALSGREIKADPALSWKDAKNQIGQRQIFLVGPEAVEVASKLETMAAKMDTLIAARLSNSGVVLLRQVTNKENEPSLDKNGNPIFKDMEGRHLVVVDAKRGFLNALKLDQDGNQIRNENGYPEKSYSIPIKAVIAGAEKGLDLKGLDAGQAAVKGPNADAIVARFKDIQAEIAMKQKAAEPGM